MAVTLITLADYLNTTRVPITADNIELTRASLISDINWLVTCGPATTAAISIFSCSVKSGDIFTSSGGLESSGSFLHSETTYKTVCMS